MRTTFSPSVKRHLWRNDVVDWVVAKSAEDAARLLSEHTDVEDVDDLKFTQVPDDKPFTLGFDDEFDVMGQLRELQEAGADLSQVRVSMAASGSRFLKSSFSGACPQITADAGVWSLLAEGFLGSTEW
jgi:hypothetical protein